MAIQVFDSTGKLKTSLTSIDSAQIVSGIIAQARLRTEFVVTTTGNIDNLDFSNADTIRMNNATLSTIRGLVAGTAGQRVAIVSIGAGQVDLAHQDTNSTAANRLINTVAGKLNCAAGTGSAIYEYDATTLRWHMIGFIQGAWITPTFAAGTYTAGGTMAWTVGAGDVSVFAYLITGKTMFLTWSLVTTTVVAPLDPLLKITIPGSFTITKGFITPAFAIANAPTSAVHEVVIALGGAGQTYVQLYRLGAINWLASTDNCSQYGSVAFEIT